MAAENEGRRQCLRCLLRDMDQQGFLDKISRYVKNLDEDIKALDDVYETRLRMCGECSYLLDGMCRACGCFVEMRAAVSGNVCPYDKW